MFSIIPVVGLGEGQGRASHARCVNSRTFALQALVVRELGDGPALAVAQLLELGLQHGHWRRRLLREQRDRKRQAERHVRARGERERAGEVKNACARLLINLRGSVVTNMHAPKDKGYGAY